MRVLTNLGGSVVTGDAIAEAVVVYHVALVARRRAELVDLPVVADPGRVQRASIAIGWLTGLVSLPQVGIGRELEDAATAHELHTLAARLTDEPLE